MKNFLMTASLTTKVIIGLVLLEMLSFMVVFYPTMNSIVALFLTIVFFVISVRRPEQGLLMLATELVIGSKGGLFRLGADAQNNGGISIRILLFLAFLCAWAIWSWREKTFRSWRSYLEGRMVYGLLAVLLVYAFVRGWFLHQPFLFADANAWGMWLLLLPVIDLAAHRAEPLKKIAWPVLKAALFWVPIKTLFLFYYFSHAFSPESLEVVYLWIRRTGVGEITRVSGTAYRIFFQSHIYAVGVVLVCWFKQSLGKRLQRSEWALLLLSLTEILVSLSRSFWIGLSAGTALLLGWAFWKQRAFFWTTVRVMIVSGIAAICLAALLLWVPLPPSDASLSSLIRSRVDAGDDAAMSRWKLLPLLWQGIEPHPILGSGFGATITYESRDPRIVQVTGGKVTTYAFEWGWLDIWFKFGLLGIPLLLLLLSQLVLQIKKQTTDLGLVAIVALCLLVLSVVHLFTPYLNHPLGFGILLALEAFVALSVVRNKSSE